MLGVVLVFDLLCNYKEKVIIRLKLDPVEAQLLGAAPQKAASFDLGQVVSYLNSQNLPLLFVMTSSAAANAAFTAAIARFAFARSITAAASHLITVSWGNDTNTVTFGTNVLP